MEDKDFAEAMRRMVKDNGKDVLLGDKAKSFISDYKGQFTTETAVFIKLLEADCSKIINEADNVLERKLQLAELMDDKHAISPKHSMPLLDLLGFLLKGDTTNCAGQLAQEMPAPQISVPQSKPQTAPQKSAVPVAPSIAPPKPSVETRKSWLNNPRYDEACELLQKILPGKKKEGLKKMETLANEGFAPAQYKMGELYMDGKIVKWDETAYFEWYRKAAEQGYAEAQYKLGRCYENGWGVPHKYGTPSKDYAKAAEWYGFAADQMHTSAKVELNRLIREGKI